MFSRQERQFTREQKYSVAVLIKTFIEKKMYIQTSFVWNCRLFLKHTRAWNESPSAVVCFRSNNLIPLLTAAHIFSEFKKTACPYIDIVFPE